MWIAFESEKVVKLAEIQHRATIGSADSNALVLRGKSVRALHGQFLVDSDRLQYLDFADRQPRPLEKGSEIQIGSWCGRVQDFAQLKSSFESLLHDSFKDHLKNMPNQPLPVVLDALRTQWFLTQHLPDPIARALATHYQEISLAGPIESLLQDPAVTDILVEAFDRIWVERAGELVKSTVHFMSAESYRVYLENLLSRLQKSIDEVQPFVDFVLPDGSRGHLIGPPVTDGARYLSIRKVRQEFFTLEALAEAQAFNGDTLRSLQKLIREKKNILFSGATGSGKTTMLKACLWEAPSESRVLVIEDTPELRLPRSNSAYLCTRTDARGHLPSITLRDLVRQALRMRPDRIVVGEVRGEEALDLMHAMNTGHQGCMGSLHANSARDALHRLQGLIRMASASLSEEATRDLIARNIHVVVHCGRDERGKRRIQELGYVRGMDRHRIILEVISC